MDFNGLTYRAAGDLTWLKKERILQCIWLTKLFRERMSDDDGYMDFLRRKRRLDLLHRFFSKHFIYFKFLRWRRRYNKKKITWAICYQLAYNIFYVLWSCCDQRWFEEFFSCSSDDMIFIWNINQNYFNWISFFCWWWWWCVLNFQEGNIWWWCRK